MPLHNNVFITVLVFTEISSQSQPPPLPLLLPTLPEHEFNHRLFRYHPNPAVVESLDAAAPQKLVRFAPPDA